MSLLEISHLTTKFETQQGTVSAVRDVSYHLEEGEVLGIVGESGSGKSVGMLTLMGLLASNGRVEELHVKGDNVMLGYYKNNEATENAFKDGWLNTGDLAVMDKDNFIYLKGRSKNMILGPSGQNIYPEEIEGKLNNMPFVSESIVIEKEGKLIAISNCT